MATTRPMSRPLDHRYKSRSHDWRVKSDERGHFDEVVVIVGRKTAPGQARDGLILHAEMMDERSCFLDVAGLCLWVHVGRDGVAEITWVEDRRAPADGKPPFPRWPR